MPKHALVDVGYAVYRSQAGLQGPESDLQAIEHEFQGLERDPYAPPGANRFRRYGNGVILPWSGDRRLHWLPAVEDGSANGRAGYGQGFHNPDYAETRFFHALSPGMKQNGLLARLILDDLTHTFWPSIGQPLPIYFGVHFIKLTSTGSEDPGMSSPDCFHQDGEPFTFAHLIRRSANVEGGVNSIGRTNLRDLPYCKAPREHILEEFTLADPFDSFAVHDPRVSHYVSPIKRRNSSSDEICERCMILVDFSPTIQRI
jgi:hypothetical protein